ncbi:bifunctional glycosyltransferase/CDP-glycerol:glycerophosphate glycerophosphotransferase [Actinoplanes sp. CA-142083]|uniref:bifunctional glycosyltransferase/CDP-glycerol:glycerophosphate glycerophosphotransferase n=1 Tax=Actinoplanes sp. CA-142083 TaxID=3239903 RepID=UPI003D9172A4
MTSPHPRPDVTVVVIVYNDAARIETAVRSVLDQSLRSREVIVVDDHSSDSTPEVMERLAAQHPDDVKFIRLAANSGHCGAPRNEGVRNARGKYIMFLDSDDTLDRHACRNMVAMAEESGADMVIGRCVRHDVGTGKEHSWMPWLVQRKVVYESLRDEPELLYDVLSTNKLYRHDFLTRENLVFLEDRYYEDNVFSAHAYLTAKGIAVIPQRVYTWNVERRAASLSITNRARDVRNLTDRIAVTRQIDALLARYGTPELRLQKDIRFIENDLRTHLAGIGDAPEDDQRRLIEVAGPYVRGIDPEAFKQAKPLPAIAAYMARMDDLDGVATAHDYMANKEHRAHLTTTLTVRDGRIFWCDRHLDDPLGREVLDVTEVGFQDLPLAKLTLGSRITSVSRSGRAITISGVVTNPLGRLDGASSAKLVMIARRNRRRQFSAKAKATPAGTQLTWTATVTPEKAPRPIGFVDPVYSFALRVKARGETCDLHLFASDELTEELSLPVRPRLSRLAADRMEAYKTDRGNLALRLSAEGKRARAGDATLKKVRSQPLGARAWGKAATLRRDVRQRLEKRRTKLAWYDRVFSRMPISKRTIVFESHMGKQFSDSPRAIYEELKRSGVRFRAVWSYADEHPNGFPGDVKLVRRQSYAYLRELGRARYWVDNQGFPHDLRKRPGTTYIQTWHGSAFKRMGFDEANIKRQTASQQQKLQDAIDRFDFFLARTEHDVHTLTKGMRVHADLLRVGYPRNDVLVNPTNDSQVDALRKQLNLHDDRKVLLYAPTFRPEEIATGSKGLTLPFSLDDFVERFGDKYVLLIRPHYLVSFALPPMYAHSVRNVANVHDVTPLMQIADAVITDYSSLMFDYALLDRPLIFHVPDYDDYVGSSRGSYFDLAEFAPGPLTRTEDELFAALADLGELKERYAERHNAFTARFCEYDTGTAAKAVVDRFFAQGARRG